MPEIKLNSGSANIDSVVALVAKDVVDKDDSGLIKFDIMLLLAIAGILFQVVRTCKKRDATQLKRHAKRRSIYTAWSVRTIVYKQLGPEEFKLRGKQVIDSIFNVAGIIDEAMIAAFREDVLAQPA